MLWADMKFAPSTLSSSALEGGIINIVSVDPGTAPLKDWRLRSFDHFIAIQKGRSTAEGFHLLHCPYMKCANIQICKFDIVNVNQALIRQRDISRDI